MCKLDSKELADILDTLENDGKYTTTSTREIMLAVKFLALIAEAEVTITASNDVYTLKYIPEGTH